MADPEDRRTSERAPAPLLPEASVAPATARYRVEWRPSGRVSTVEPTPDDAARNVSLGRIRPGSLLAIAIGSGEPLSHVCGGLASCGTCAIRVLSGGESLRRPAEIERRTLDALEPRPTDEAHSSMGTLRLACQCMPDGSDDLIVEIPAPSSERPGAIPGRSD